MQPAVTDISQLARLQSIINSLENLALQVYFSPWNQSLNPADSKIDLIAKALATAYDDIAKIGGLQTSQRRSPGPTPPGLRANMTDKCPPGYCPDGSTCVPCDGSGAAFPYVISPQDVA